MIYKVPSFNFYSWQRYVWQNLKKYNVVLASRQHGKTTLFCELINSVVHAPHIKQPLVNLCSDKASRLYQLYSQRLNELFKGLDTWSWRNAEVSSSTLRRADYDLALVNFVGSVAKPTGCTGTPSHLNVIDECELVDPDFIFESAFPSTAKTEGINVMTGTWGPRMVDLLNFAKRKMAEGDPHWFAFELTFGDEWSRQALTQNQRDAIESGYDLTIEDHRITWNSQYAGIIDKIYHEGRPYYTAVSEAEAKGRIQETPIAHELPVNLCWDDGRGTTAIWAFQVLNNNTFHFFDYFEWTHTSLPEIAKNRLDWYLSNNFIFGVQVLPHTMAEKSYEIERSPSRQGILKKIFKNKGAFLLNPRPKTVENKLALGNAFLPYCMFHRRTLAAVEKLKKYSRAKQQNLKQKDPVYLDKIARDRYAHCGDALTEAAQAHASGSLHLKLNSLRTPMFQQQRLMKSLLSPY